MSLSPSDKSKSKLNSEKFSYLSKVTSLWGNRISSFLPPRPSSIFHLESEVTLLASEKEHENSRVRGKDLHTLVLKVRESRLLRWVSQWQISSISASLWTIPFWAFPEAAQLDFGLLCQLPPFPDRACSLTLLPQQSSGAATNCCHELRQKVLQFQPSLSSTALPLTSPFIPRIHLSPPDLFNHLHKKSTYCIYFLQRLILLWSGVSKYFH